MPLPVRSLPLVQNWDCHACGNCCKEYAVAITDEERQRIEAQGWENDPALEGWPLFTRSGPWWARRYFLNQRSDDSCVFLNERGLCRIHERFGYAAKPLACRLFPFVLVPAGDHWRVGMRYACPSAAGNKGRELAGHIEDLRKFAAELAKREGLDDRNRGPLLPPRLEGRLRLDWPDTLRFVEVVLSVLSGRRDRMERRWRKCLALANLCRQARLDNIRGKRLGEFLDVVAAGLESEVPTAPTSVAAPNWVGRILFRQMVALFTRKDHGPDRGPDCRSRSGLLLAAWRFARGTGPVPRLHNRIPETTFEQVEATAGPLPREAEEVLERYYTVKVESLQFCGGGNFGLPFWEGLELLAVTFPVVLWVARALGDVPPVEALTRALTIVDNHFGFNRVLRSRRQRVGLRLLAGTGELSRLIAWYGR
jgi:lysine-N-methylase